MSATRRMSNALESSARDMRANPMLAAIDRLCATETPATKWLSDRSEVIARLHAEMLAELETGL